MNFETFNFHPSIMAGVHELGYTIPTPIQIKAIPPIMKGCDVIGLAQTGTGKTASFTLPMIDILSRGRAKARMPRSLILEPTRELAAQVAESFEVYGKQHKLTKALLIGGERDTLVPAAAVTATASLLPRSRIHLVDGGGHAPFLSAPGEVARVVRNFLLPAEADRVVDANG